MNMTILADKIIALRKSRGWSQEELAEQLNVSRQAVSKWESAQSVPDLDKILQLSALFGISTDTLLKDELPLDYPAYAASHEETASPDTAAAAASSEPSVPHNNPPRRISPDEAANYIELRRRAAGQIALATALCILSPAMLIFLPILSEIKPNLIGDGAAVAIGMGFLLLLVTIAVGIYIVCGSAHSEWEYLEKQSSFTIPPETANNIKEKKRAFRTTYTIGNMLGSMLCILSVLPLFITGCMFEGNEILVISMVIVLLLLVALGVACFLYVGVQQSAMDRLLREGDWRIESEKEKEESLFESIFWPSVTTIYLTVSFLTHRWDLTWLIWVGAAPLSTFFSMLIQRNKHKK